MKKLTPEEFYKKKYPDVTIEEIGSEPIFTFKAMFEFAEMYAEQKNLSKKPLKSIKRKSLVK